MSTVYCYAWISALLVMPLGSSPSNRAAAAVMPETVESVLIVRFSELPEAGTLINALLKPPDSGGAQKETMASVSEFVLKAKPLVWAEGGSHFEKPHGFGTGNYDSRSLWSVAGSLTELEELLRKRTDVVEHKVTVDNSGATFFESSYVFRNSSDEKSPLVHEKRFIHFVTDRLLLIAERRDDLLQMISNSRNPAAASPIVTSFVSASRMESPIVVARRYDKQNKEDYWSPFNYNEARADVDGFGCGIMADTRNELWLFCKSIEVDKSIAYFESVHFRRRNCDWNTVKRQQDVFDAVIVPHDRSTATLFLRIFVLFGANVFM